MRNDKDDDTETAKIEAFATNRMVLETDAKQSEWPAELEEIVISAELLGGAVSRAASRSRNVIEATWGEVREMEA
jgi:hypothetical protein